MLTNVTPDEPHDDSELIRFALGRWGRTARLCAIRLTESLPAIAPLVFLILRR